jgi:GR25 family glycosyltransferase involved in LPS biosynthesis
MITDNFNKIDFDIILLACWRQTPFSKKYNDFLKYYSDSTNTHSYIITFNGAKKLINSNCLHNIVPTDDFFRIISSPNNIFNVNDFTILQTNYDICNQEGRQLYQSNIIDKPIYNAIR